MTPEATNTLPAWLEWPLLALAVVIGWALIGWCFQQFFPPPLPTNAALRQANPKRVSETGRTLKPLRQK
jgi:hypothetical protein